MTSSISVAQGVAEFDTFTALFKLNPLQLIPRMHTVALFSIARRQKGAVLTTRAKGVVLPHACL